jgi:SAM-dependent methyltransferase
MEPAYRDDLAHIHDAGFGFLAKNAAPVLVESLRRAGLDRGRVVDLGCGSGILSEPLAAAGYDVLGIDLSEALIALARRRVPAGEFRVESLLTAELPPCVAVAAVGECCNYLFDRRNSGRALARLLRRIYGALAPGGLLIFDVATPGRSAGPGRRNYVEGDGWAVLVTTEEDEKRRELTRRITTFRQVGALYRRDHEVHQLRLLPHGEVTALLRDIGFRVRVLRRYGPLKLLHGMVGFLGRKPG